MKDDLTIPLLDIRGGRVGTMRVIGSEPDCDPYVVVEVHGAVGSAYPDEKRVRRG